MSDETQDRVEVLSEAYDRLAAEPAVEAEPVEAAPETVEPPAEAAEPDTRTAEQRARDGKGRFAPKTNEKTAAAPEGAKKAETDKAAAAVQGKAAEVAPAPPAAKPEPAFKAPQSWKPAMRELAAKLPPEFRPIVEESIRRDQETTRVLQETAQARQFATQVQQRLSAYEGIARANGMDALGFASTGAQSLAAVYQGGPQQAVATVASAVQVLTQRFGPQALDMINAAMEGKAPQGGQPAPQQSQPDVNALVDRAIAQRLQVAQEQRMGVIVNEFAKSHEFYADVEQRMERIFLAEGKKTFTQHDLEEAYDLACRMDEGISQIIEQRKAAEAAKAQIASTQRTRAAASSVRSMPAAASAAQPVDRREILARRFDELST